MASRRTGWFTADAFSLLSFLAGVILSSVCFLAWGIDHRTLSPHLICGGSPSRNQAALAARPGGVPPNAAPAWATKLLLAGGVADEANCSFFRVGDPLWDAPPFWMAVDDVKHSAEYVLQLEKGGVANALRAAKAGLAARGSCRVLDLGSNGGFYSLLTRSLGCTVLAVDAQPRCLDRLNSAAGVNGWVTGLSTVWTALGPDGTPDVHSSPRRCSGLWSAGKGNDWIAEGDAQVSVGVRPLGGVLAEAGWGAKGHIDLLKLDVEGSELNVLQEVLPWIAAGSVHTILLEVAEERVWSFTKPDVVAATWTAIYAANMSCYAATTEAPVEGKGFPLEKVLEQFAVRTATGSGPQDWVCQKWGGAR